MIAIQPALGGFDKRWIEYCQARGIPFKLVNCYRSDIISQLTDCSALMWQFYQGSPKDIIMAKDLLFALEQSGLKVFPDFRTAWHFDDKVGQKYLLESINAPLAPAWVFLDKREALEWVSECSFPKVFKLRGGAGSQNVRLVKKRKDAVKLINKAFSGGFRSFNAKSSFQERWRLYCLNKSNLRELFEGLIRFIVKPPFEKVRGRERGYIYFQEYIDGNDHDIRVVVIGDFAFAIKRMVRDNDFRASGSGYILYDHDLFNESLIELSFKIAKKLIAQCVAMDFVYSGLNPMLLEISYGFTPEGYDLCPGYWDKELTWHEGSFNPYGWMVDSVV